MKTPVTISLFLLSISYLSNFSAAAEQDNNRRLLAECFLYRGAENKVWIGQPLASLGMIGVSAGPPTYYLRPELEKRLAPLVNELEEQPKKPQFWWWRLPKPKDTGSDVVLLRAEIQARQVKAELPQDRESLQFGGSTIQEVQELDLIYAEFISARWRNAWKALDNQLTEIVTASRTAPSTQKSKRLLAAIEKASIALGTMRSESIEQEKRRVVREIEPRAGCVRTFQKRAESSEIGEWGGQLRRFVQVLRIDPKTRLPEPARMYPLVETLAQSASADKFLQSVTKSFPAEALDDAVIYSQQMKRVVYAWQVKYLSAVQFFTLKKEAEKELARRAATKPATSTVRQKQERDFKLEAWGLELRSADPELLADKGVLRGTVVKRVSDSGTDVGLKAGDLIFDYSSVYDIVMGGVRNPKRRLASIAKYGGKLYILRDDKIVTLNIKRPE